ncbi:hypothetical protein LFL96_36930 (plasmid) [Paraburkholderia sp. D15]|uniref:hypothetical protein n=1 Tax=Paraburkholderia sp. D15 TaxID=2880218 RepID=UPI002478F3CB|nr:hypothetical protein [Paraburkholderia sp. D15]WGS55064.1 hypothetical protein LFL96_36930 [Paraburkholderia sp. D15]
MAEQLGQQDPDSLRLRRVTYQTAIDTWSEGVVTDHDLENGIVTVMDDEDQSFWCGQEDLVEVIV